MRAITAKHDQMLRVCMLALRPRGYRRTPADDRFRMGVVEALVRMACRELAKTGDEVTAAAVEQRVASVIAQTKSDLLLSMIRS